MSVPPDISELEREELGPPPPAGNGKPPDDGWRVDKQGREYIPRGADRRGVIYRQGEETQDQARERDSRPRDKRPRKSKRGPMPEAPRTIDLKELEAALAEGLKAPAMLCAAMGDEWAANHFVQQGPFLARNLITASQHNPWLRAKLEEAATGQEATMKIITLVGVGGALVSYTLPPLVYWLNLPVPDRTRAMFGVPERRQKPPPNATAPPPPPPDSAETAETPAA